MGERIPIAKAAPPPDTGELAAFPDGVWPRSNTNQYDATIKDGDADWSLKKD